MANSPIPGGNPPAAYAQGNTPQQTAPTDPTPITPTQLSSYYSPPVTAQGGTAALATSGTVGTAPTAKAAALGTMANITGGMINPNDATNAAAQMGAITAANSPYIQQAQQQGYLSAAARGLGNSSIGAGASEAAAVAAAEPLAQQNAQIAASGQLQNSQLQTQASEFNAGQANANQQLQAQLATQTNQFNAQTMTSVGMTNAQMMNSIAQQTQALDEQINQQGLSGSQAQQLAALQGKYNSFIAQNQSAAGLMNTMLGQLGGMFNNPQVAPDRMAAAMTDMKTLLAGTLDVMNTLEGGTGPNPQQGNFGNFSIQGGNLNPMPTGSTIANTYGGINTPGGGAAPGAAAPGTPGVRRPVTPHPLAPPKHK